MASTPRPSSPAVDPDGPRWTTDYFKRLLIERHAIRAALENPGGSVILTGTAAATENSNRYSSVIGNDFHLDLIEAERILASMPSQRRRYILQWVEGLSDHDASYYYGIKPSALRMRRQRAIAAAVKQANEG